MILLNRYHCPIAVKCLIVTLRHEIALIDSELNKGWSKYAPDLFNRFTDAGCKKQEYLQKIRYLRSGHISKEEGNDFIVGNLHFNLSFIPSDSYAPLQMVPAEPINPLVNPNAIPGYENSSYNQ